MASRRYGSTIGWLYACKERTVSSEELIKLDPDVIFVVYFSDEMKQDIYETFHLQCIVR